MSRFKNSEKCLDGFFNDQLFTGAVLTITENKKVIHHQAYGLNDLEKQTPMQANMIFMGYSLTKIATAIGAMIGLEQGLFQLDDPVAQYLPEFKTLQVLNSNHPQAQNVLTIRHLLTMTGGMSLIWGRSEVEEQTRKCVAQMVENNWTLREFVKNLAQVPVKFEPGSDWLYGMDLDVFGAIIEVTAKKTFAQFLKDEIFDKLEMPDTRFYITDKTREANVFKVRTANELVKVPHFGLLMPKQRYVEPNCALGGNGLYTTSGDYIKLANVLIDGVGGNGVRILSPKSVEMLQTDQIQHLTGVKLMSFNSNYTYSFGMRVRIKNDLYPITNIGEMGWDGFLGSTLLVDPEKKVAMVLMLSTAYAKNEVVQTKFFDAFYEDLKHFA